MSECLDESEAEQDRTALDLLKSASVLSSPILDLSKREIKMLPETDFPSCPRLECFYLEGNMLTCLPSTLFIQCPALVWLDLRNNSLKSLTPSITNLKHLRTLLLEGNKLVKLPSQLGSLKQLNGLSLADNPLECPPENIVKKGIKAVLQYLRNLELAKENSSFESEVSSDEDIMTPMQSFSMKKYPEDSRSPFNSQIITTKSAILQARDKPNRKSMESPALLSFKSNKGLKKTSSSNMTEKEKIEEELARERSKQSLKDWREETARINSTKELTRETASTGQAIPSKISSMSLSSSDKDSSSTQNEEDSITEWTKEYARRLKETRENGGLVPSASSNLLQAELKLAEALAMRKHFETQRTRKYRLRAFTGDT